MKNVTILSLITVAYLSQLNAQTNLGSITVSSATKSDTRLENTTSNINVITSEDIQESKYTSIIQILNTVSGINYTSNGSIGATSSVMVRGAGNNRVLVLINGIRYNDPSSTSGASFNHILLDSVEKIEIIKGAQSGIWGADASAGVINIITKKAKLGTTAQVNLEAGSFGTKKFGASVSHRTAEYDVKLSANKIISDSFSVQSPKGEDVSKYEDDAYSNLTLQLNANYNLTDSAKIGMNITLIDALKEYDKFAKPDDTSMKSDINNKLYQISYLQNYKNHNFSLKIEKSDFSRDEIGTKGTAAFTFNGVTYPGSESVKIFNGEHLNLELSDSMRYREKDYLVIGIGTSSDDVDYVMTDKSKKHKKNKDNYAYLTNSNAFNNFIFTQSARYDNYDNFENKTTGKIGLKYNINQDLFISSNIGLAYNVPNIMQELNPWGKINSDLNPENTKSIDVSLSYKQMKVTYFKNTVTDLIEWSADSSYKNLDGESIFKGIEVEYKKQILEDTLFATNYTFLSARNKDGGFLKSRPRHSANVRLDYYGIEDLHLGINTKYIGWRYSKNNEQGIQTGKYAVVDFVANYDVNEKITTYVKIDNLFDKEYQVINGYATAPLSGYIGLKAQF